MFDKVAVCDLVWPIRDRGGCGRIIDGSVAEWLKAHDSKSCGHLVVSEVRILSLPPSLQTSSRRFFVLARSITALRAKKTPI